MRKKEVRAMDDEALKKRMSEAKKELMVERGQLRASSRASNPGKLGQLKREVARILTLLREREMVKKGN